MKSLLIIRILIAAAILCSCNNKHNDRQGEILTEDRMQAVLWDILQADAFTQNFIAKDSTRRDSVENAVLQEKIFALHKIRREDFYTSYRYYSNKPGEMKKILDSVVAKAERDRTKLIQERFSKTPAVN